MHRAIRHKAADFISGVVSAAIVFAAVPTVLVTLVGLPIPRRWDGANLWSAHGLFDLLALMSWIAWAGCCWPLLRSVTRRVRLRDTTTTTGERFIERLAARIATAVLVISPLVALGSTAAAIRPPMPPPPISTVAAAPLAAAVPALATPPSAQVGVDSVSLAVIPAYYTVVPGDTLWSIAERFYGDGDEWEAIATLNLSRVMSGGARFIDPNLIYPGWTLTLPGTVASGSAAQDLRTSAAASPTVAALTVLGPSQRVNLSPTRPLADHVARQTEPGRHPLPVRSAAPSAPVPLPELIALGIGVIGAAALSRRVRRLRRSTGAARFEGTLPVEAPDAAIDAETLLGRFDGAPVLDWFELANRHLAAALAQCARPDEVPGVRLWRIGPDGVDVWLAKAVSWAPAHWELRDRGSTWHLPTTLDPARLAELSQGQQPWVPVCLPVGEDDGGTWLVTVEPGCCLPVIGSSAPALAAAMRVAVESWAWAEQILVTDDPELAECEALLGVGDGGFERPRVLFFGDPSPLSSSARLRCGIVTTLPLQASDLTVAVDERAATIHPLGVTLRPHLQDPAQTESMAELLAFAATPPVPVPDDAPPDASVIGLGRSEPTAGWSSTTGPLEPGIVEVHLLTAQPRIDGLREELPTKRARRATELVAYLALHRPDPVTSDRLRTRVLGTADADAAAKTLFNTAGAARRALGTDESGAALFPPGTKTGHYTVSDAVTVDVDRATALINAARDAVEPDQAMALYRLALALVEGEPLSGLLSGYGWWQAEGHAARISALLVDAACELARLAADGGYGTLASWALAQARLIEPYSEALSRAAMRVAAALGDVDLLRREWMECQRRVDELDPGSLPSERTEQLFAELSRRVPAGVAALAAP